MQPDASNRLVLLTGPSGAGRSTALNALEDLGFETIDNLPLALAPTLLDGGLSRDMALGIDVRTRDFSPAALTALLSNIANQTGQGAELVVLEAEAGVLAKRYNETRRRHPMAPDGTPEAGIAIELEMLGPLRDQATVLIDTSALSPHDLRAEMQRIFGRSGSHDLAISVQSFSYKRGLPLAADVVFDCRFLKNPHWQPDLRPMTGQDPRVADHIATDPRFAVFREKVFDLLIFQLPAARDEGKAHFTVAFGCSGGKHRSVALAESIARGLATAGWQVSIRHRELERRALAPLDPVQP
ncbi:RNase adapter RapZ [Marinovum sp.]|uniref:RNase adapter RapZ n=1 Tax=Marinovum sp. TaxID=2024839 RepID=UPI002B269E4D|nr:RNase adapter RapZ [Marinovum sp.]